MSLRQRATVEQQLAAALKSAKDWQESKGVRPVVDHLRREVKE